MSEFLESYSHLMEWFLGLEVQGHPVDSLRDNGEASMTSRLSTTTHVLCSALTCIDISVHACLVA